MAAGMTPTIVCAHAVQLQRAAEDIGGGIEAVAPHALVDDDDAFGLRAIFFRRERAAEERLDAENGGKIVGDPGALDPFGAGAVRQIEALAVVERDAARTASRACRHCTKSGKFTPTTSRFHRGAVSLM